jgi:hypothetical protein
VAKRNRASRNALRRSASRPQARTQSGPRSSGPAAPRPATARLAPVESLGPEDAASSLVQGAPESAPGSLRAVPGRTKIKPNSLLAARAETEYLYVGKDLRRIAVVGVSLFGVLIGLWILLVVIGLAGLY